jgi:hypothetical protein
VAKIAETQNHHPDIEINYDKVKISITDHEKGGVFCFILYLYVKYIMNRSYSKIRHIQESNQRLENRLLNEQVPVSGGTPNAETKVSGPFGNGPIQYYVYNKGGKFYVYQTSSSQKTPILMDGDFWSNKGVGYNAQADAEKIITQILTPKFVYKTIEPEKISLPDMPEVAVELPPAPQPKAPQVASR